MQFNDLLYNAFLEELNALEKFRMAYSGMHTSDLLERDDPDVKRLVEAIAFYTARTRLSAIQNIQKTRRRLFDQYFSFLLAPLPAMGILQAEISGRFTDTFLLPKDSEVFLYIDKGMPVTFRTIYDLRILPVSLKKVEMILHENKGFRILLHFQSSYPRNDSIDIIPIYLNYLNNYNSSLRFQYMLRNHLEKASVFFEEKVTEVAEGIPCPVSWGAYAPPEDTVNSDLSHPLQKIRTFFHFPQKELYVNFKIPQPPRNWTQFTICMDMNAKWPKNLSVNRDIFQPFSVPIINLKHNMAQPILCNGMQEQYPVLYPEPKKLFTLHSIIGVFQIGKEEMTPLKPGIITSGSGSYELEYSSERGNNLILHLPEAFQAPKKIAIDAQWFQPWCAEKLNQEMKVLLADRNVEGVSWDILGTVQPHEENNLKNDGEALLQILSFQRKPIFNLEEIGFLLKTIGSISKSPFQTIPSLMQRLEVSVIPQSRKIGGVKHIYQIQLKEFDESYRPLVEIFLKQLLVILQSCSADAMIAIKAKITGSEEILSFE